MWPKGVLKPHEQGHEIVEEEERASTRRDIHGNDWKVLCIPREGRSRDAVIEADWGMNRCKVANKKIIATFTATAKTPGPVRWL